jgi:hypothetical protein
MEFPAVSQTRYDFWKEPQYTQSGMWWFTLAFGIFGLHHLLLRSPQTALIFFITNILLLGYPWFYDLIQLSSAGGLDTKGLNEHGLGHPWGSIGLAKGMWLEEGQEGKGRAPSPWWFLLYSITLPFAVVANLVAGDSYNAFARLLLYILPFGSIITMCALFYDFFTLIIRPNDLLINGSKRIFPFTVLGMDVDGHSPSLTGNTKPSPNASCNSDGFIVSIMKMIGNAIAFTVKMLLTVGMFIAPEFVLPLEIAFVEASSVVDDGIFVARDAVKLGETVVEGAVHIGTEAAKGAVDVATAGVKLASEVATLSAAVPKNAIGSLQQTADQISQIHVPSAPQYGGSAASASGANANEINTLDWFAGGSILALIAGGLIISSTRPTIYLN